MWTCRGRSEKATHKSLLGMSVVCEQLIWQAPVNDIHGRQVAIVG